MVGGESRCAGSIYTDHRSIGHGIVGSAIKEREVHMETLNAPCQQVCLCVYVYMCLCEGVKCMEFGSIN